MSSYALWPAGALALSVVVSYTFSRTLRNYAISRAILDAPNHRSSHHVATPRGGGMAIASVVLAGVAIAAVSGYLPENLGIALCGGGIIVAAVGWADDRSGVSALPRLLAHVAAGVWAVYWLGGLPVLDLGSSRIMLGPLGSLLAVIGIAWLINLYNFMDGIDGLAAAEAIVVSLVAGMLLIARGLPALGLTSFLVGAACAGFLPLNWAPARLFMGDCGSGSLGFVFGTLAVASEKAGGPQLALWLLLLGVFVFDATVTLLRRVLHRERWYEAHRSHAYQRAARKLGSHAQATLSIVALNIGLALLACIGTFRPGLIPGVLVLGVLFMLAGYVTVERRTPMHLEATR